MDVRPPQHMIPSHLPQGLEEDSSDATKPSKTQLKKEKKLQERRERRKVSMAERRKRKKERKIQLKMDSLNQNRDQNLVDSNTNGESHQHVRKENWLTKRKKESKERCKQGLRVAVDLSFGALMNDSELASVVNQIKHAYGVNLRVPDPFHIYLVGLGIGGDNGSMAGRLSKMQGYSNWRGVEKEEKGYSELFSSDEMVYLTPDSPNTLMDLDPTKVYIIGGLTDYNRAKDTTFTKACSQGIATAKLPLHLLEMDAEVVEILCIDHVFFSLLYYSISHDWIEALHKALPPRKTRTAKVLRPASSGSMDSQYQPKPNRNPRNVQ